MEVYKSEEAASRAHDLYRACLASWSVDYQEKRVATRLGETFVIESGPDEAPAIILLHGTMATTAMWRDDIVALSENYHVYAVDVIGDAGFSAPVRPDTTTDAHALWLQDVLESLGQQNAHLVGLSLGGWVALDYAVRNARRVTSLTLIAPAGVADRNIILWALPLLLLGSWGAEKVQERILGPASELDRSGDQRLKELSAAIFEGMRPRKQKFPEISDQGLGWLDMPILVLLGADDVTMDSSRIEQRFSESAPHATVRVFPGKRHFLGDQSEAILSFIRHVESQSRTDIRQQTT